MYAGETCHQPPRDRGGDMRREDIGQGGDGVGGGRMGGSALSGWGSGGRGWRDGPWLR